MPAVVAVVVVAVVVLKVSCHTHHMSENRKLALNFLTSLFCNLSVIKYFNIHVVTCITSPGSSLFVSKKYASSPLVHLYLYSRNALPPLVHL
jgi:hypothetical protein